MRRIPGLLLLLAACGGGDDDPAIDAPTSVAAQCEAVRTDWRAQVSALATTCTDDPDCISIGAVAQPCQALATLAVQCEGLAVNAAANTAAQAQLGPLAQRWDELQCQTVDELGRTTDCQPLAAICDRGTCVLSFTASCFGDAGVL